ncbi:MarR family transcriptional regulator [Phocaeicola oris]|uniref:MarR family transcriptional regulator n=1 Tax=Phocaeicola oris TaxID=2896850 RepID=UPI00234EF099|nr:MarR family transcriptional regulator [Phocaeicola oris]MCE2615315.1 MarR family transcriptional regulator [Phocaeicola oris]
MNRDCLCHIRDIYRSIAAFEHTLQQNFSLNINEAMLLCIVSEHENISSGELAEEMGLSNSNMSKVIASMEKQRLIDRHACKEDLRCMKFSITKKGEQLLSEINCDNVKLPECIQKLVSKDK